MLLVSDKKESKGFYCFLMMFFDLHGKLRSIIAKLTREYRRTKSSKAVKSFFLSTQNGSEILLFNLAFLLPFKNSTLL